MLAHLAALVDQSLVQRRETPDGTLRFTLLETVQEFGLERLAASGAEEAVRRRHALTFLDLAEAAAENLTGPQQSTWVQRLELEHDNLRAALQWSWEHDEAALGLRLASALGRFWWLRGHISEGRRWLDIALARGPTRDSGIRVRALHGAGLLAESQSDYPGATTLYEEGLAMACRLGDTAQTASFLNKLGDIAFYQGDYARARTLIEESLHLRRAVGYTLGVAAALSGLGDVATATGDYAQAQA